MIEIPVGSTPEDSDDATRAIGRGTHSGIAALRASVDTRGPYNLTNGGDGGFMRSVETRRRMSLAQIGNQKSKGFKHSAESRAKMSEAQRGNQKAKGWKNLLGYHHTPETKARISSALKGRKKRARRSSSL